MKLLSHDQINVQICSHTFLGEIPKTKQLNQPQNKKITVELMQKICSIMIEGWMGD